MRTTDATIATLKAAVDDGGDVVHMPRDVLVDVVIDLVEAHRRQELIDAAVDRFACSYDADGSV